MTRRMAILSLATLFLCGSLRVTDAYILPIDLGVAGIPSPTDVVGLIDALTRKDSSTTVDVKLGATVSHGKLLVARTRVGVVLERSSHNWRGRMLVQVTVPSDVIYSVDLSGIRPEHIRLDGEHRLLIVAMPTPTVESITPILTEAKAANTFKRARFKFIDKYMGYELQNTMLKEDFLARARKTAESQLPEIRKQGSDVLQAFLQRLLAGPCPGVTVVVE